MSILSPYQQGFFRVAAANFPVTVANPQANAQQVIVQGRQLNEQGVGVVVFPELCLTGYSAEDLFLQNTLQIAVEEALSEILSATADWRMLLIVGAPVPLANRLYNCAIFLAAGEIIGVTPKSYLPNYREFYEKRYFSSGFDLAAGVRWESELPGAKQAPIGPGLVRLPGFAGALATPVIAAEICEDLWVPEQPSTKLALAGANIVANLSGSPATVARSDYRRLLVAASSARQMGAYLYSACAGGESTNDLAWDGQTLIYQQGKELAAGEEFSFQAQAALADIDLEEITQQRQANNSFTDCASQVLAENQLSSQVQGVVSTNEIWVKDVTFSENSKITWPMELLNVPDRFPFVPADARQLDRDCRQAYQIQVAALQRRITALGKPRLVIGVSGGLDSTHALLVAAQALDQAELPRDLIYAVTMPGFATSEGTKSNAYQLCAALGVPCQEIDIRQAAAQMLSDLGHPFAKGEPVYDVTFENVQAGLRTDYLFRLANHLGGLVVGTGDLSELAQGWCTYGVGDHMSHYGVNAGVPKTTIQHLIRWVAQQELFGTEGSAVLHSILDTEISPELVPVTDGKQIQSTQDLIGPYELHDFFLYYLLHGHRPVKIAFLAQQAWQNKIRGHWPVGLADHPEQQHEYQIETIVHWLDSFLRRFFNAQFKRTCVPNGPKVMSGGALSPRGDWRMPSDIQAKIWREELADLTKSLGRGTGTEK